MTKLEIERKFLIDDSTSLITLLDICQDLRDVLKISQSYILPKARIRKTTSSFTQYSKYFYNEKKKVNNLITDLAVHEELEYEISEEEYNKLLLSQNPDTSTIEKMRFVFGYKSQIFELDFFLNCLQGVIILEIELPSIDKKVELPPFLKILKEVSKDSSFTNFSLASVKIL